MKKIGAIIFDFDGVLAESNQVKESAFEDLAKLYPQYAERMVAYHREHYSSPRMIKFKYYVNELMDRPGDAELLEEMASRFSKIVKQNVIGAADVPGARALLEHVSKKLPLYISSMTPQGELTEILEARGIDGYFVEVFGNPPIKKYDAIQRVLSREELRPSQVIFIGDSYSDYEVSHQTGVVFLGRDSGFGFEGHKFELYKDLHEISQVIYRLMEIGESK